MKRREVAAARGPSNRDPPSPPQTPPARRPASPHAADQTLRVRRSRPARVAKFPVNCVNYLTLGSRKIWEPYFAKLNAATQRRYKCA